MKLIDLSGQRFGRLIAVEYVGNSKWKCLCDCGKAIEGRWIGLANFCPWCGRVMEWEKDGDTN